MSSGYDVTSPDMRCRLGDPYCQPTTARLLDDWFGYEIRGERGRATVVDGTGREVNVVELHRAIQAGPELQREL